MQNMGDVFRATARQPSEPQAAPIVPTGKNAGRGKASDESSRTTGKRSGQRPKKR